MFGLVMLFWLSAKINKIKLLWTLRWIAVFRILCLSRARFLLYAIQQKCNSLGKKVHFGVEKLGKRAAAFVVRGSLFYSSPGAFYFYCATSCFHCYLALFRPSLNNYYNKIQQRGEREQEPTHYVWSRPPSPLRKRVENFWLTGWSDVPPAFFKLTNSRFRTHFHKKMVII